MYTCNMGIIIHVYKFEIDQLGIQDAARMSCNSTGSSSTLDQT